MTTPQTPALPTVGELPPLPDDDALPAELWAEIYRLRAALRGPTGYASWQEAATDERIRRVRAERLLKTGAEQENRYATMIGEISEALGLTEKEQFEADGAEKILAAIAQDRAARAVPDGLVLVPREPELISSEINDACWAWIDAMPHHYSASVWNDLKPAVYAAICKFVSEHADPAYPAATPAGALPSVAVPSGVAIRSRALADEVLLALEAYSDGGGDKEQIAEDWAAGLLPRVYDTLNLFAALTANQAAEAPPVAVEAPKAVAWQVARDAWNETLDNNESITDAWTRVVQRVLSAAPAPAPLAGVVQPLTDEWIKEIAQDRRIVALWTTNMVQADLARARAIEHARGIGLNNKEPQ